MNEKIIQFIEKQRVATISCIDEQHYPYCFNCFFAFNSNEGLLYFKSSPDTRHAALLLQHPQVAGTILPDKLNPLALRGLQFTGTALPADDPRCASAAAEYYKKMPFARAVPGELWTIQLESIKMTDNTAGFGKKLLWQRTAELQEV